MAEAVERGPDLSARIDAVVRAHSEHPSISLIENAGNQFFWSKNGKAFLAYRRHGGRLFQFGGVAGCRDSAAELLLDFSAAAERARCRVLGIQIREVDATFFREHGFRLNEFGRCYSLSLTDWSMRGSRFMKLRNKIRQPGKTGVEVIELGRDRPLDDAAFHQLQEISDQWLRAKGRTTRMIRFLVGELERVRDGGTRCFAAVRKERIVAFITYAPYYGPRAGFLHDLTRRREEAPPGTMETINAAAISRFQSEGVKWLSFGLTPFVGRQDEIAGHSPIMGHFFDLIAKYGAAVYPAESQVEYKRKWDPQLEEPEYLAYQERFELGDVWALLRATNAI